MKFPETLGDELLVRECTNQDIKERKIYNTRYNQKVPSITIKI